MSNFESGKSYRLKESCVADFLSQAGVNTKIYSIIGTSPFKIIDVDKAKGEVMSIEIDGKVHRSSDVYLNLSCIFTVQEFEYFQLIVPDDCPSNFEFDETKTYALFTKNGILIQKPTSPDQIMEILRKSDLSGSEILIFEHATTAKPKTVIQFS